MLKIVELYLNVLLSLREENKITSDEFERFISLLDDEIREYD